MSISADGIDFGADLMTLAATRKARIAKTDPALNASWYPCTDATSRAWLASAVAICVGTVLLAVLIITWALFK